MKFGKYDWCFIKMSGIHLYSFVEKKTWFVEFFFNVKSSRLIYKFCSLWGMQVIFFNQPIEGVTTRIEWFNSEKNQIINMFIHVMG